MFTFLSSLPREPLYKGQNGGPNNVIRDKVVVPMSFFFGGTADSSSLHNVVYTVLCEHHRKQQCFFYVGISSQTLDDLVESHMNFLICWK